MLSVAGVDLVVKPIRLARLSRRDASKLQTTPDTPSPKVIEIKSAEFNSQTPA